MKALDDCAREDWRLRLALIKESVEYRTFWAEFSPKVRQVYKEIEELDRELQAVKGNADISAAFRRHKAACATKAAFNSRLYAFGLQGPFCDALAALDPKNEDLPDRLPVLFREPPAVVQIEMPGTPMPFEARRVVPLRRVLETLEPSERILKIDLSRKRGEIEAEFKRYLDTVERNRTSADTPEEWGVNYGRWLPDTSRFRTETWQALKVYRLRRKAFPYRVIEEATGTSTSVAKKAFSKAFSMIEGRPYDDEGKEFFRREVQQAIKSSELQKTCATCPKRDISDGGDGTCEGLCLDILPFVEQEQKPQRELVVDARDFFSDPCPDYLP